MGNLNNMENLVYLIIFGIFISLVDTLFLNWRLKKINVTNISFKKTFFVSIIVKVIIFLTVFTGLLVFKLQEDFESLLLLFSLSLIISFFVFKKLLTKYYGVSFKQTIIMFIQSSLFLIIIITSPLEIRFISEVYVAIVKPNEIGKFCNERGANGCRPSLICEYSDPCAGSSCLQTAGCRVKQGKIIKECEGADKSICLSSPKCIWIDPCANTKDVNNCFGVGYCKIN